MPGPAVCACTLGVHTPALSFPGFPGPETVVSVTDSIGSLGLSEGLQGCCSGAKGELSPAAASVPLFPYRNLARGGTGWVV